jgi:hypothetical protein
MVLQTAPQPKGLAGVIELRIRDANQLFNTLDPTPFPEKDLDQDAEEFIFSWATELPHDVPIEMHIYLTHPTDDPHLQHRITETVHAFFAYRSRMTQHQLRALIRRGRWSLLIGLVFLAACVGGADIIRLRGHSAFYDIIAESLVIGGWVAMWRPMEIFLYDWWPLRAQRRVYDRLAASGVIVTVADGSTSTPPDVF